MWHDNNIETWRFLQGQHPPSTQKDHPGLEGCFVVVEKCALPIILLVTCVSVASIFVLRARLPAYNHTLTENSVTECFVNFTIHNERSVSVTSRPAWHYWALKYVDDTTVSEVLAHDEDGRMRSALDEIEAWSATKYMYINCKKTKEMILGPLSKQQPLPLLISDHNVEQVTSYKLLGVTIDASLKWVDHIVTVT